VNGSDFERVSAMIGLLVQSVKRIETKQNAHPHVLHQYVERAKKRNTPHIPQCRRRSQQAAPKIATTMPILTGFLKTVDMVGKVLNPACKAAGSG
jgi:20S proteasome alpha/beta subunit